MGHVLIEARLQSEAFWLRLSALARTRELDNECPADWKRAQA